METIAVGVDGSDSALRAVSWAAAEAVRRGSVIRLVSVAHLPPSGYQMAAPVPAEVIDQINEQSRQAAQQAQAVIEDRYAGLTVDTAVLTGPPVPALIEESANAQLMVLGSRGLGGFTGMLVGSTAVGLVAHGHCPVAVIRGDVASAGPVVVGVDGSPASAAAVALAFEEASLRGAELVAVHTWTEYGSDLGYASGRHFVQDWDSIEEREDALLAEQLAGWQEKYPNVSVRRVVTRDRPVRCLLDRSADAQLLVVGSRGRGGFTGMLLGSTSQALVYHATCPLLVARQA